MDENKSSTAPGFDRDDAPDLSRDGWPEKFAKTTVRRGRPPVARPKVATTIRLSAEVMDHFKAGGRGWQTRIDAALRDWIGKHRDASPAGPGEKMKRGTLTAGARGGGGRSLRLPISHDKIAAFCEKNGIRKFSLFGSILRDDFGPESDVDVVAEFRPGVRFSLFDLVDMEDELSKIVGRNAEIVEFQALRSWMREEVSGSMELFYESPE